MPCTLALRSAHVVPALWERFRIHCRQPNYTVSRVMPIVRQEIWRRSRCQYLLTASLHRIGTEFAVRIANVGPSIRPMSGIVTTDWEFDVGF